MGEVTLEDVLETMKRDAGSAWRCRVANQHEQTPDERHEFSVRSREARAFVEQQAAALQSEKARADAAEADSKRLDWLAREWEKNGCVAFATERPRQPEVCNLFTVTTQHIKARGFREVIDAAIGASHD